MRPGFLRVVEPASTYFSGYDAAGDPTYRWTDPHVQELLSILSIAKSLGITVVLGDWGNPVIGGDPRVPVEFIGELRNTYGYTNIAYYNVTNEPNDSDQLRLHVLDGDDEGDRGGDRRVGYQSWLSLVGPDNANSWDDTQAAQELGPHRGARSGQPARGGLMGDRRRCMSIPSLIGAYDSHRYATIWGVENGVYGDQVRARRERSPTSTLRPSRTSPVRWA